MAATLCLTKECKAVEFSVHPLRIGIHFVLQTKKQKKQKQTAIHPKKSVSHSSRLVAEPKRWNMSSR